jgi:MFS family permease
MTRWPAPCRPTSIPQESVVLRRAPSAPAPGADRARWQLVGIYVLTGLMFSSWMARLPSVRAALGLSTAQVGMVLLAASVGALSAVVVSGAVHARLGSRRQLVFSAVVISAGYLVIGLGPTFGARWLLVLGVVVNGVGVALANLAMNVESGRIERAFGRTVIPQFHAGFSAGAVVGSVLGGACSALGVPVEAQLAAVAVLGLVWRLTAVRAGVVLPATVVASAGGAAEPTATAVAPADAAVAPAGDDAGRVRTVPRPSGAAGRSSGPWRERRTLLIGVIAMAASLSEGTANNWLSLATVDAFARPEAVGAMVLGVFIGSMTLVRALGTRLIDRFGRVAVLRVSGVVALTGLAGFGLAPTLPAATVAVAAWGLGSALAVPIAMAAASDDPTRAAGRVAVVSSFATVASLTAPPLLGLAAESLGARHAMLAVTVALVASVAVAGRAAPLGRPAAIGDHQPAVLGADAGGPARASGRTRSADTIPASAGPAPGAPVGRGLIEAR